MNQSLPDTGVQVRKGVTSDQWLLIVATIASVCLLYIPGAHLALYPIRLFVTLIHEGGHAVMTVLTGGSVAGMAIHPDGSGLTFSAGGWPSLIYMAGYLGATTFGAVALHLSRSKGQGRASLMFLAAATFLITVLWLRPWGESAFGFFVGLAIGLCLLIGARRLTEPHAALLTAFLSVQLCLNSLYDIRDLLWLTTATNADNDAVFMARAYGLTPWFWAALWSGFAGVILFVSLRAYWRASR